MAGAPFALPLPDQLLMEKQLVVTEIPPLILISEAAAAADADADAKTEEGLFSSPQPRRALASQYVHLAENGKSAQRSEIDTSKIRSTDKVEKPRRKSGNAKSLAPDARVALICGPREATNQGRDPESRWYIRGVLHSHPITVFCGAWATLLVMIALPISLVAGALLLLSTELPDYFVWVPGWLLAVPIALPPLGLLYLIFGFNGNCRVCGQKLFVHRSHIKHPKAHRVRGLGYIFPLCIQVIIFSWFRCTHCGTSIRLKE